MVGSDLVVTSAEGEVVVTAHLTGHPDQPAGLSYLVPGSPRGYRVSIDYLTDTVEIAQMSGTNVVTVMRYHLLPVQKEGRLAVPSVFSWQTYRAEAGQLQASVVSGGATISASIRSDNSLQPGKTLVPAKPTARSTRKVIFLVFGGAVLAAWAFFCWPKRETP